MSQSLLPKKFLKSLISDSNITLTVWRRPIPFQRILLIVHFSNLLVKTIGYNQFQQTEIDLEGAESTKLLKLNADSISIIKNKVKEVMEGMREVLSV